MEEDFFSVAITIPFDADEWDRAIVKACLSFSEGVPAGLEDMFMNAHL